MAFKIGIDVGGTFTDFLLITEDGGSEIYKTPTTTGDASIGVPNGLQEMADARSVGLADFLEQVEVIVHRTTVTINALLNITT